MNPTQFLWCCAALLLTVIGFGCRTTWVPSTHEVGGDANTGDVAAAPETCGNGVVDIGEGCDDGNRSACDGCDTICAVENRAAWFPDRDADGSGDATGSPVLEFCPPAGWVANNGDCADADPTTSDCPALFVQSARTNALVVVEAESYHQATAAGGKSWRQKPAPGAMAGGAVWASPNTGASFTTEVVGQAPRLDYRVRFLFAGSHYVWVRGFAAGAGDASIHVGLDGSKVPVDRGLVCESYNTWSWSRATISGGVSTLEIEEPGLHTVNLWMREDGFLIDRLLLTTNPSYVPAAGGFEPAGTAICGNGVVESGEQCDRGGCCTPQCELVARGVECRGSANSCDAAEFCLGTSAHCPNDRPAPDGLICAGGTCSAGRCSDSPPPVSSPEVQVRELTGQLRMRLAPQVPSYYDVAPQLELRYDSAAGNGPLGVGWRLWGLATVERTGSQPGRPAFDDSDRLLLNGGLRLLPCTPSMISPSCLHGGNLTSEQETYQRLAIDETSQEITISQKNGIQTSLAPLLWLNDQVVRWAVTTVVSPRGHQVEYAWWCDGQQDCYPETITYQGRRINFYWQPRPDPVAGSTTTTRYRLHTVDVEVAAERARTYAITYTSSPAGRSLLAAVQLFGTDTTLDGDGDVLSGSAAPPRSFVYDASERLVSARDGDGPETVVTYKPANHFDTEPGALGVPVVSSFERGDSAGERGTTRFVYDGGLFDGTAGTIRGFATVRRSAPARQPGAAHAITDTRFRLAEPGFGAPVREIQTTGGVTHQVIEHAYKLAGDGTTQPYQALLSATLTTTFDGSGISCVASPCARARRHLLTYDHDEFGNVVETVNHGDYDAVGDETTSRVRFRPNLLAYIVDRPAVIDQLTGMGHGGVLLDSTILCYDGGVWETPPVFGNLTEQLAWQTKAQRYRQMATYEYDAASNLTARSEADERTEYGYDSTDNQFVVWSSRAEKTRNITWHRLCDRVASVTDANGSEYFPVDALCRQQAKQ